MLRAVLGTGVYVAATALLGLAIGALLRHATGAVGVMFVLLLLAPGLLGLILPSSWADTVLKYLPSNAASSFTSVTAPTGMLSPGRGAVVLGRVGGGAAGRRRGAAAPSGRLSPIRPGAHAPPPVTRRLHSRAIISTCVQPRKI